MAYTCAVFPNQHTGLDEAQEYKFDLVCQKLDLQPGMRLLDVGCGWGGMVLHAVRHYGVEAVGVTLSQPQAEFGAERLAEAGLSDKAGIRHGDYRDVTEDGFDRVSSIGLTEHIGVRQYPAYFEFLRSRLRPDGLLLNHAITRNDGTQRARASGFINRYIFPDGELVGPAVVMGAMNDAGFEFQHEENFRRHYALTLAHWIDKLRTNWGQALHQVGVRKARTWWLYLAASQVGFEINRIQLHQFLGSASTSDGTTGYRWRNTFS
jgi:cyclopropane-fatty-acyl-phospholipid synthase